MTLISLTPSLTTTSAPTNLPAPTILFIFEYYVIDFKSHPHF